VRGLWERGSLVEENSIVGRLQGATVKTLACALGRFLLGKFEWESKSPKPRISC
jgi:hypothetical protein